MDLTGVAWRKSSYSGGNGGNCVEFAILTGVEWRKSSYSSGNGGACVEFADLSSAVAVRDSKDPEGSALILTPAQWRGLTARIRAGRLDLG